MLNLTTKQMLINVKFIVYLCLSKYRKCKLNKRIRTMQSKRRFKRNCSQEHITKTYQDLNLLSDNYFTSKLIIICKI